ncbi:MAG: hypothetical protein IPJ19_19815 [Planctomycetes bacterium]|nr:hypothetical protein [Planctomycetota bacterium]
MSGWRRGIVLGRERSFDAGDLRLERPGALHVRVELPATRPDGEDSDYAIVREADGTLVNSIELKSGAGSLGGLAAGRDRIESLTAALRAPAVEVEVQAGVTSEARLVAEPAVSRRVDLLLPAAGFEQPVALLCRAARADFLANPCLAQRTPADRGVEEGVTAR